MLASQSWNTEQRHKQDSCYLFGEAVIRIRWHASGDVEDGFHGGRSVVRSRETRAAIPLEATHKATVRGQVHLRDTRTV